MFHTIRENAARDHICNRFVSAVSGRFADFATIKGHGEIVRIIKQFDNSVRAKVFVAFVLDS